MKGRFKLKKMRGKFFYRIFAFFFVSISLVFLISFISYDKLKKSLVSETTYYNNDAVASIATSIDKEFEEIQKMCLFMTADIRRAYYYEDNIDFKLFFINEHENIDKIRKRLTRLENMKGSIDSALANIISGDCVVSQQGAFRFDDFFDNLFVYNKMDSKTLKKTLVDLEFMRIFGTCELKKKDIKTVTTRVIPLMFSYLEAESIFDSMIINIKEEYIKGLFEENRFSKGNQLMIIDREGEMITCSDMEFFQSHMNSLNKSYGHHNGAEIAIGETSYFMFKKEIKYSKWTVFSYVPRNEFLEKSNYVLRIIIIIDIVLFILGLFLALFFSSRLYSPIANLIRILRDENKHKQEAGSMNEIDFITSKLDFLNRANRELSARMRKLGPYMQENVIKNVILYGCKTMDEEEILSLFEGERIRMDKKYFVLVSFRFVYTRNFLLDFEREEQEKVRSGIETVIKESVLHKFSDSLYIDFLQEGFAIVTNTNDEDIRDQYQKFIEELSGIFKEDERYIKMLVYIGERVERLSMLTNVYSQGRYVMEHSNINQEKCLLEEEMCIKCPEEYIPNNFEERLENAIQSGNAREIDRLMDEVFERSFRESRTVAGLKRLSAALDNIYRRISAKNQTEYTMLENDQISEAIRSWNFYAVQKEYAKLFSSFIEKSEGRPAENTGRQEDDWRKKVFEEYFETNYGKEDMCLETMAADLHYNKNYLSRMIKEFFGESFGDHLIALRMKKAMDLLRQSDLTIDDIAEKVGISSRATFNRQFKKYTSVSPTGYRLIKRE